MFSYSEFAAFVKKDGMAKQNRFFINIGMPPGFTAETNQMFVSTNTQNKRNLHMLCKSASLPGVNLASVPITLYGEAIEAPYNRTFGGATFTFYVDKNFLVKAFFDRWIELIQSSVTRNVGYYKDFVSTVNIVAMDKQNGMRYEVILFDAHPKSIGTLSFDQTSNEIMTLDITFDYRYYDTVVVSPDAPNVDSDDIYRDDQPSIDQYANDFLGFQNSIEIDTGAFNDVGTDITTLDSEEDMIGDDGGYP